MNDYGNMLGSIIQDDDVEEEVARASTNNFNMSQNDINMRRFSVALNKLKDNSEQV